MTDKTQRPEFSLAKNLLIFFICYFSCALCGYNFFCLEHCFLGFARKAQEDLAETEGRRAAEALEREAAMERRLQSVELELRAERAGREATQVHLLEADEGAGEREAAWEAQRQILVDDAERLREMLHDATRERDEFRLRVAALDDADETKTTVDSLSPTAPGALSSSPVGMAEMMAERKAFEAEVRMYAS